MGITDKLEVGLMLKCEITTFHWPLRQRLNSQSGGRLGFVGSVQSSERSVRTSNKLFDPRLDLSVQVEQDCCMHRLGGTRQGFRSSTFLAEPAFQS